MVAVSSGWTVAARSGPSSRCRVRRAPAGSRAAWPCARCTRLVRGTEPETYRACRPVSETRQACKGHVTAERRARPALRCLACSACSVRARAAECMSAW